MRYCSLLIAAQHWLVLVQAGGQEAFKSCWDSHVAGNDCVPSSPTLAILLFYSAWGSEETTDWTELSQEQSRPSRSSQVDCLIFFCVNDNMTVSVSHLRQNQENNVGLPWLSEWLSICSLPAPRWCKAQSLSFVISALLSERLSSTSWLSKTQFTAFCACLL